MIPRVSDFPERFKNVKHPKHNPSDDDCICPGCMKIIQEIADEMWEKRT